jgi:predicted transcriptional regulator
MSTATRVTLSLPPDTAKRLDEFADTERRSRSNAATVLLDEALERIVAEANTPRSVASAAAEAHLTEHRRLCGLTPHEETK